jgi:hypothetical protein
MGIARKLKRQIQRNNGTLPMKKVIARKMGKSLAEVNRRYFNKKKNGGNEDGEQ